MLAAQSCPTLCDPMDCSPPSSSVPGILQARILEWVAISFSREPRDQTRVSCIGRQILYHVSHRNCQIVFLDWLYHFTFPSAMFKRTSFFVSSSTSNIDGIRFEACSGLIEFFYISNLTYTHYEMITIISLVNIHHFI